MIDLRDLMAQTNMKSGYLSVKVFLPINNESHAPIVVLTNSAVVLPRAITPGASAYLASKLTQLKVMSSSLGTA